MRWITLLNICLPFWVLVLLVVGTFMYFGSWIHHVSMYHKPWYVWHKWCEIQTASIALINILKGRRPNKRRPLWKKCAFLCRARGGWRSVSCLLWKLEATSEAMQRPWRRIREDFPSQNNRRLMNNILASTAVCTV